MTRHKQSKSANQNTDGDAWLLVRVAKPDICHLRYTLEAYEGLCVPTTLPGGAGLVRLTTSKGLLGELTAAVEGLSREIRIEVLESAEGLPR